MKKLLPSMSVVAAMLFVASSALAGGLNLAWNNCIGETGGGGVTNRTSACTLNGGTNVLTGSFVPSIDLNGVTGVEFVMDLIVGDGTSLIPAWWEIGPGAPGGAGFCRGNSLTANAVVNPSNVICNDWAAGAGNGGLANYNTSGSIPIPNQPAHRRFVIGFAVAAAAAANLTANSEYFGFNALINNARTVGSPSCAGCTTPVCLVLNSANAVIDVNPGELIQAGTTPGSNFATWQGVGPSCALVPTRNATWGQVKSLYH